MSEKKKTESITEKKISRRSMLKWTGALAAAVAVGVGAGYETDQLLRPVSQFTTTEILPVVYEEKRYTQATTAGATFVYVSNGRIVRTQPMWFTESEAQQGHFPWKIPVGGKTYSPPLKWLPAIWGYAARNWVYSSSRGKYPMKRVDWDPNGDRHPENRGKSDYVRISWDQAYDIIASEIKRIQQKYGPSAIFQNPSFHKEWGALQGQSALSSLFWNINGGSTTRTNVPNSWEGWTYGASFVYGYNWSNGITGQEDMVTDVLQNSKQVVMWGMRAH